MTRCTAKKAMPDGLSEQEQGRWTHPDAVVVYEGSLYDEIECPHCGTSWKASPRR